MAGKAKSQWDFGELFDPATTRRVLTVSELTTTVRRLLENQIGQIWITGEVTNLRVQSSGHIYFTLKDANAQLACILFSNDAVPNRELLEDGRLVILQGALTVYEARGQYQLRVIAVELRGQGALQAAFEQLKRKLQAEGLFESARKRPLPRYPQRVGLVTSTTGAAISDVLHVIERRHASLELVLSPCRVQGLGAGDEIAAALRLLNAWAKLPRGKPLDLILLTRGGGSLEDLWAFNEEVVARAIFQSAIPVISAVGHEIDFTISDFVADFRAATPSAAAELITEGAHASRRFLEQLAPSLQRLVRQRIDDERLELSRISQRLTRLHPRNLLDQKRQYLDELRATIFRCTRHGLRNYRANWDEQRRRLLRAKPSLALIEARRRLKDVIRRVREQTRSRLHERRQTMARLSVQLHLLSPENVLTRGYSITAEAETGRILRSARKVRAGTKLKTRLSEGEIFSVVERPPKAQ
jgi:exodeoxyribonuclease VII large subunit